MAGIFAQIVWLLANTLNLFIVGLCVRRSWFRKYLFLNLFLIFNTAADLVRWWTYYSYGFTSLRYFYIYLYTDVALVFFTYLLVLSFYDNVFRHSIFRRYVRRTLGLLFLVLVAISAIALRHSTDQFFSRLFFELEQNLYFAGLLLNSLLWISLNHLRVESKRLALLATGLGIMFASHAAKYSFHYLFQGTALSTVATSIPPFAYLLMLSLWAYTFLRVPEDVPAAEPVRRPEELLLPARFNI